MPKQSTPLFAALIVTRNSLVKASSKLILGDLIHCQNIRSAPDSKQILKSSTNVKVLILDWSLQDKYGSIMKCLKEAKARKNVLVINIFISTEQKKWVFNHLPNMHHNNKIYSVVDELLGITLPITLFRLKVRLNKKLKSI